jgi:hypothetical protein
VSDSADWADAIEAIKQLKARYFRAIDTKDWSLLRRVLAADVVMDTTEASGGVVHGAERNIGFLSEILADVVTVHHGHMPEIELTSPTTATGVWSMEDELWWPDGMHLHGYGHYHETYELIDGSWQITTLRLTRLREDTAVPAPE